MTGVRESIVCSTFSVSLKKINEILNLYRAAEMLEPFMRTGCDLLKGKVLYTLFSNPQPVRVARMKTPCIAWAVP